VTLSWFLAAARIMAGPPMSMVSTSSSKPAFAPQRLLERIEVDGHQIDVADAVLGLRFGVAGMPAPRQDAAVDARMQRLHATAHDLRELGDGGHVGDRSPASASALAVPPVERISTPSSASLRANSTRPVLSDTESRARRIGRVMARFRTASGAAR
jgi:hypothetical protein